MKIQSLLVGLFIATCYAESYHIAEYHIGKAGGNSIGAKVVTIDFGIPPSDAYISTKFTSEGFINISNDPKWDFHEERIKEGEIVAIKDAKVIKFLTNGGYGDTMKIYNIKEVYPTVLVNGHVIEAIRKYPGKLE